MGGKGGGGGGASYTKYYMGLHLVICASPIDEFQEVLVDKKVAWKYSTKYGPMVDTSRIYLNAPYLFGGVESEGGIVGALDVMFGGFGQGKNLYLSQKMGAGTDIPAYRNVVSAIFNAGYITANVKSCKPWAFKIKSLHTPYWGGFGDINGSANVAYVIYDILTNLSWGINIPEHDIDKGSFEAAAETLFNEGLGVSFVLANQISAESFISRMSAHANGVVSTDPSTGKWLFKLLRYDYDVATLPVFDESNIVKMEHYDRASFGELVNEIVITYRKQGAFEDSTLTVQDTAAINIQGAVVSQATTYMGIDTDENANRLAMRDLRIKSSPLSRIRIQINRSAYNIRLGDVIKFTWNKYRVYEEIFRVLAISYGTLEDGTIIIDAVQDVFGLANITYIPPQPPIWVDPVSPPEDFTVQRVMDVTYYQLANKLDPANLALVQPTDSALSVMMGEPEVQYVGDWELWDRPSGGGYSKVASGQPAPTAKLKDPMGKVNLDIVLQSASPSCKYVKIGSYLYIDDEICRIDNYDPTNSALRIARGCLDTVPANHDANSIVLFASGYEVTDNTNRLAMGAVMNVKGLPTITNNRLPIDSATENTITMSNRQYLPYAPGQFKLNGFSYPNSISGALVISWAHRDRLVVMQTIADTSAGNIGPEAGTTYRIDIFSFSGSLLASLSGITATSQAVPLLGNILRGVGSNIQRIKLTAVRDGYDSWQSHSHPITRNGYGYNYGKAYGN